jgi:hypothetical protein
MLSLDLAGNSTDRKTLGLTYTAHTIYVITALFVLGFAVGGAAASRRLQSEVTPSTLRDR